jgi:hypothetical protein
VKCIQSEEDLSVKKVFANVYIALAFLAMIFFNELFTIKINQNEIDYKHWDNKTVTLNDFTVEYRIKNKTWNDFIADQHNYQHKKLGERLTAYLKKKIYE